MKKIYFLLVATLFFSACKINTNKNNSAFTKLIEKGTIKKLSFSELQPYLHIKDSKIYVINFWATWCKPCIDELPYFEKLNTDFKNKNIEVLLVSVDYPDELESKVIPLLKEKQINSPVVLFDDSNLEEYFAEISEDWMGSLPGTLIYNKSKRQFFQHPVHFEDLKGYLKEFN